MKHQWVRLTKVAVQPSALVPACSKSDYLPGEANLLSLPIDYWIEGFLIGIPEVGKGLRVARHIRNGIQAAGLFESSPVTEIRGKQIMTLNSIYLFELKSPPTA